MYLKNTTFKLEMQHNNNQIWSVTSKAPNK